jgi:regulator of protease activity HflC (stomatin/prohibitin superfamily)
MKWRSRASGTLRFVLFVVGLAFIGLLIFIASFVLKGLDRQTSDKTNLGPLAWTFRIVGVVIIVVGGLWSAVTIVPAGFKAVLLAFGDVRGTLDPGIHLVVPGVNSTVLMETRTQKESSTATAASRDLQTVTTSLALNFRIDPAKIDKVYENVGTEYKVRIIDPAVQESIKVVTARYTAEELIKNRAQVKAAVEEDITKRLAAYNLIVEPLGLSITNFDFSPEFNRAIEQKQVAQQEAEKQKYVLQQAELEKETEITRAEGKAQAAKLNAAALQVQGGSLVVAREWIEKWNGQLPSVATGGGSGGGGVILDLSTLLRNAPAR